MACGWQMLVQQGCASALFEEVESILGVFGKGHEAIQLLLVLFCCSSSVVAFFLLLFVCGCFLLVEA